MTVKQLIKILEKFPSDALVQTETPDQEKGGPHVRMKITEHCKKHGHNIHKRLNWRTARSQTFHWIVDAND